VLEVGLAVEDGPRLCQHGEEFDDVGDVIHAKARR
jgi:hypothetical protein